MIRAPAAAAKAVNCATRRIKRALRAVESTTGGALEAPGHRDDRNERNDWNDRIDWID